MVEDVVVEEVVEDSMTSVEDQITIMKTMMMMMMFPMILLSSSMTQIEIIWAMKVSLIT